MPPEAPAALEKFLKSHDLSQTSAAEAIGVSKAVLSSWLSRRTKPRAEYRQAIERWTRGEVPALGWLDDDDRALIDAVRPLAPAPAPAEAAA